MVGLYRTVATCYSEPSSRTHDVTEVGATAGRVVGVGNINTAAEIKELIANTCGGTTEAALNICAN